MNYFKRILSAVLVTVMLLSTFVSTGAVSFADNDIERQIRESIASVPDETNEPDVSDETYVSDNDGTQDVTENMAGASDVIEDSNVEETTEEDSTATAKTTGAVIPDRAMATSGTCGDNLTWVLDDSGTLTISGTGLMEDYTFSYWASGYYESEAPWFSLNSSIKEIVVENGVKSIGWASFAGCTNLLNIEIPSSINSIGGYSFYHCDALVSVIIPDATIDIGCSAFAHCISLTSVTIGDSVENIGMEAFYKCSSLQSIVIPDSVVFLEKYALYGCENLKTIKFGDSLTEIPNTIVESWDSLEVIDIGDSINTVDFIEFGSNPSLKEIWIGKGVKQISTGFSDCTNLDTVHIKDIELFYDIEFGYYLTSSPLCCGADLYINGELVENITIPNKNNTVNSVFSGCTSIKNVVITDGITTIGGYAFRDCTSLESVTIPDSVTSIGGYAFRNCTSLESVTIPDSVTSIGYDAFYSCNSLTSITIPDSVTSVKENAFTNTGYYNNSDNWENGILYINDWVIDSNSTVPSIPDLRAGVKHIADKAFYNCDTLVSITLPVNMVSVGANAFKSCDKLSIVTIPKNVSQIADNAFEKDKIMIVCAQGSYASTYAVSNGIDFKYCTHAYIDYTGNGDATCTEDGTKTAYCDYGCGEISTVTDMGSALDHSFTVYTSNNDATCTEDGTETSICDRCDESDTRQAVGSASGHTAGDWTVTKEATLESEGERIKKCRVCGELLETEVIPKLTPPKVFSDVKATHWFYEAVNFAVSKGYMNGMSETKFSPNGNIKREQFVLILANIAGVDTNEYKYTECGMTDVKTGQWYSGAVAWAVKEGYVSGMSATTFGRGKDITRAQLARLFYVYAEKNGIDVEGRADLSRFADSSKVQDWMRDGLEWAVDAGIINGMEIKGKLSLNPNGTATRAQAAVMLKAFDSLLTGASGYTVTFDSEGGNTIAAQTVKANATIAVPDDPVRAGYVFQGWFAYPDSEPWCDIPLDLENYKITENVTFYAGWGSDTYDVDDDGLSHAEEISAGTDPYLYDTDADGLPDGEEKSGYGTNPVKADSDGDGVIDGVEIELGLNPLLAKTDGATKDSLRILDRNYVNDSEDFSLTLGATPSLLASTSVHFHPKSMIEDTSGLISEIIDVNISAESDFNSAELVFDYSDIDLKDIDENDLTFLYLNEETGMYEKVESYVDNVNKTVTCYPSHFSRYVVGDILCVLKQFNFDKSTIVVDGQTIEAYEIAHSEFDVKKDGFAFHNFQIEGIEGFCYGFTLVSFLNYIEKMPISREGYDKLLTKNIPSYDLSIMERFSNKLLYDSSERDLFNSGNNYMLYTPSMSTDTKMTTNCITYWFFEQHNVLDHAGVNVMDPLGYLYIKESLENDKPVPLTLYTTFHRKAHSVLAYGFYSTLSADYILVYDCNYPGELRYIELKKCLSNYIKSTYGSYSDIRIAVVDIPEGPYVEYSNNGTLSGRVCRAADRTTPVSGATVEIYKDNVLYKTVTSDSNGNYLISLPEGSYSVKTTCRSYLDFKSSETVRADETTYVETFLLIEGNTTDSGKAKGKVFNSLSGQGVADVTLTVKKDWNSTSSAETVKTTVTNGSGEYTIELPIGNYTVIATKEGHSPSSFNIIVQKGTTDNQNGVITPVITGEDYLITLTWGENPEDLDSHVAGYLSNDSLFHVYYNNDKQTDGQNTVCELDYDDRYSYGPEHITLKTNNDSPYYYFVKKYKGTGSLSESGAKVTIEQGNILIAEFYVPTNLGKEDCWNVFAIKNGELIIRNTISTDPDIEYAD